MKKKLSKRYKKLITENKDNKALLLDDVIKKLKKIAQQNLMNLSIFH